MRRVSYKFPRTCDYAFQASIPFSSCIANIAGLSGKQDNFHDERGAIKREFTVKIASTPLDFEPATPARLAGVTEEADFSLTLADTILRAQGKRPEPAQTFFVKVREDKSGVEIFVSHITEPLTISPRDVVNYIQQVVR